MSAPYKVVHYINQFYGGFGAEDTASMEIVIKDEPVGPGKILQSLFGSKAVITKTIICGDNHISENLATVVPEIMDIIRDEKPDIFIAGPGFNAGRYGMGCGALTAAVWNELKIASVTSLFSENPGTDLYKGRCYILQTDNSAKSMKSALEALAPFALRLADGDVIGDGVKEGYHGTGPAVDIDYSTSAGTRGVDMLLKKFAKLPFKTEVVMPNNEIIPLPVLHKPLSEARIALVTDGGLVPKGNPDNMVPTNSKTFNSYTFEGKQAFDPAEYEVSHQGYNNAFVLEDPNRLVPLDSMRILQEEGVIGSLLDSYYTTAGVMTPMDMGKKFGQDMAKSLKEKEVDAVILTST
jgi:glycine reductase